MSSVFAIILLYMETAHTKSDIKKDLNNLSNSFQEDNFLAHQTVFSSDENISRYKKIIYSVLVLIVITIILGTVYYAFKSDVVVNDTSNSANANEDYDTVMYVPKNDNNSGLLSGRVMRNNLSGNSYKYILVSEDPKGKITEYFLKSDNIDLGLFEGYPVNLIGQLIDDGNAFNVKSVKLK